MENFILVVSVPLLVILGCFYILANDKDKRN